MTADPETALEVLDAEVNSAVRDVDHADLDVTTTLAKVRRDLDDVEAAVRDGLRIRGSVSGESFAGSNARDLARAIEARQAAYDRLSTMQGIRARVEDAESVEVS